MKCLIMNKPAAKSFLLTGVLLITLAGTATAGLDYYTIYIGKKIAFTRYLNKPLSLENLPIGKADLNEQLVIEYYQCNMPDKIAKNRSISLRDKTGKVIKTWKFDDARNGNAQMAIPVKELVELAKNSNDNSLSLYYSANDKKEDEQLAFIAGGSKAVGYVSPLQLPYASYNYFKSAILYTKPAFTLKTAGWENYRDFPDLISGKATSGSKLLSLQRQNGTMQSA